VNTEVDEEEEQVRSPTPPLEPKQLEKLEEKLEERKKVELLGEDRIQALFSGAPHFSVDRKNSSPLPRTAFPWDYELAVRDASDSLQLAQPAFSAATLRPHLPKMPPPQEQEKQFIIYDVGVFEVPSMLGAQGIEPGTVGFVNFLEQTVSDNLVTDLQQAQSSNGVLEATRNKDQMHTNPERLGIRTVDMGLVYDRLVEFGDLIEAFQGSPERMTILNNQSSEDLYANLFTKFLSPPRYDDTTDPTGMKVQIDTLLRILGLRGVWFDFSLVEWRIRLGQILWSEPEELNEGQYQRLWTDREILLLQITLACELLLRLDAVTSMDTDEVIDTLHVSSEDYRGFLKLKTRKTDWDLVLARLFLDNILVIKDIEMATPTEAPKARGLLSLLSRDVQTTVPTLDLVLLPRHQSQQLSGLAHFAETLQWPDMDLVTADIVQKLGVSASTEGSEQQTPVQEKLIDPTLPTPISVYGTPLSTPRPTSGSRDSYFGRVMKPSLSRHNSRTLTVPLASPALVQAVDAAASTSKIGGWLSRSYLTGLILPGETISHFLMSTLLENDKLAIAALGDSANLYGGFVYAGKSWWSKSSVVGRVLACLDGSAECMGWILINSLPASAPVGWYALSSEPLSDEQPLRITAAGDLVARHSALVPGGTDTKPEDLVMPRDPDTPPSPSIDFTEWKLLPVSTESLVSDDQSDAPSEPELHRASLTFSSFGRDATHTFTLTHDVLFVTSFPCTPPAFSPTPKPIQVLKGSIARTSSSTSIHSTSHRLSRSLSRRNSHGYEPLLSHPPDSPSLKPKRVYTQELEDDVGQMKLRAEPMKIHPLHISYKYRLVPVTEILDPEFILPFKIPTLPSSPAPSDLASPLANVPNDKDNEILVLDARASKHLELLARAWCAEKGFHAIIGRAKRSCLACCVREARGLGISVVVRV
jgi:hypothetical protein